MITTITPILKKLPSPIYKILAQRWIDREFPRHIFIETTATCNLACSYCPREKVRGDMRWELFREIVDECSKYGPRSFSLHLFGEPLLYPNIIEAIRYIKHKNRQNTVLLTTNGTLLNRFIKDILDVGTDRIIWSWRKNDFNGESIQALKKIGLVRLLVEETPKEEFEKWSKFPRVEIKHLHNYGGKIDTSRWGVSRMQVPKRYPCYHLWLAPAVRWNGDIVICCADPKGESSFGKYGDTNLYRYWHSEGLVRLRGEQMRGVYSGICATCNVWSTYPDMFWGHQCS